MIRLKTTQFVTQHCPIWTEPPLCSFTSAGLSYTPASRPNLEGIVPDFSTMSLVSYKECWLGLPVHTVCCGRRDTEGLFYEHAGEVTVITLDWL